FQVAEPSGSVLLDISRRRIGRLVGALQQAGFQELALRLARAESVREYTFKVDSDVSEMFVSVGRNEIRLGDRKGEEVVILTKLGRDAPHPDDKNPADWRLLLEASADFKALLANPENPDSGEDPPSEVIDAPRKNRK
ncbi:MAG: hypothetical protein O6952_05670, partial [Planctomycetota bacterium]|nr:hypothetical protein [Planctomycetota bacterium]